MKSTSARKWLLLVYKIPREPTALRVSIWRKLKQLGAIAQQDAAWVLPATSRTQELFQWLASEIVEMKGEATLWSSELLYDGTSNSLERQFVAQVDEEYREVLAMLKKKQPDLATAAKRYQQALARDYFDSPLGRQVRDRLLKASGDSKR